jgi:hypothetical protein
MIYGHHIGTIGHIEFHIEEMQMKIIYVFIY